MVTNRVHARIHTHAARINVAFDSMPLHSPTHHIPCSLTHSLTHSLSELGDIILRGDEGVVEAAAKVMWLCMYVCLCACVCACVSMFWTCHSFMTHSLTHSLSELGDIILRGDGGAVAAMVMWLCMYVCVCACACVCVCAHVLGMLLIYDPLTYSLSELGDIILRGDEGVVEAAAKVMWLCMYVCLCACVCA